MQDTITMIIVSILQVIGGIQRFAAINKVNLMHDTSARKILSRKCSVYGSGLSRQSLLVLARQHNDYNQIQRETTFPEVAASCRRLLFSHFAPDGCTDDEESMPLIPRFNTKRYSTYKQECMSYLHSPRVVRKRLYYSFLY